MNWSSIFLIKFLIIFSFNLKGAVTVDLVGGSVVYGVLGHPGFLDFPLEKTPADLKWLKDTSKLAQIKVNKIAPAKEGYTLFQNGTLKINNLTKEDAGTNYILQAYDSDGKEILKHNFTLIVQEFLWPEIFENCSTKILTCEVTHNNLSMPKLVLYSNKGRLNSVGGPFYTNGRVSLNYTLNTHSGDFICEAKNNASTQRVQKQINCSDPTGDMFFYLLIGGGIAVFIIIWAVLLYCIRKKRAKRRELEAEERELRTRITVENGLKNRKLPQPPVRGESNQPPQPNKPNQPPQPNKPNQPPQPNKPPALHSEVPQQAGPPQPRPRPHQKPPRHMREKP